MFTPGRLQGRRAQNVLDRDAEPISTFLCIGQVRVDKAFLPRLGLVRPACCRLSDSVLAAAALIAHPPTAPRAGGSRGWLGQSGLAFCNAEACESFAMASVAISRAANSTAWMRALRILPGPKQLHDLGEAAPVALDRVRCGPRRRGERPARSPRSGAYGKGAGRTHRRQPRRAAADRERPRHRRKRARPRHAEPSRRRG